MVDPRDTRPLREELLDGFDPSSVTLSDLCRRCAQVLDSASVALELTNDGETAVAESSDTVAERAADLQATLGEGPTLDALRLHRAVLTADVARDERWPQLASAAAAVGLRAVVAVPLLIDSTQLGALTAYYTQPTIIDGPALVHAAHVARVLTGILLGLPVQVSSGLAKAISLAAAHQGRVHQAAGIISVDEGCSVDEAMIRLRAYAYANEKLLGDVADAVVAQGLRLT